MSIRDWMNSNSTVVTAGAAVLLVVALGLVSLQYLGTSVPSEVAVYYYDMETETIFAGSSNAENLPPITTPAGTQTGVRAHIFACGACPSSGELEGATPDEVEAAGAFIAWVEQFSKEARAAFEIAPDNPAAQHEAMEKRENGHFVKRLDDERWALAQAALGPLQDQLSERCGENDVDVCRPDS